MHDRLTRFLQPVAGLFDVDSAEAMALRLLGGALVLLAAFWISRTAQHYLVRRLHGHDEGQEETIRLYRRVVQVFVWGMGVGIAVHTLGIDLTHIFAAGGLFAVGLAFAMKTLLENFVAGLILRLERVIEHGDVLCTSDGDIVRVKKIGPRTMIVRTKAEAALVFFGTQPLFSRCDCLEEPSVTGAFRPLKGGPWKRYRKPPARPRSSHGGTSAPVAPSYRA